MRVSGHRGWKKVFSDVQKDYYCFNCFDKAASATSENRVLISAKLRLDLVDFARMELMITNVHIA